MKRTLTITTALAAMLVLPASALAKGGGQCPALSQPEHIAFTSVTAGLDDFNLLAWHFTVDAQQSLVVPSGLTVESAPHSTVAVWSIAWHRWIITGYQTVNPLSDGYIHVQEGIPVENEVFLTHEYKLKGSAMNREPWARYWEGERNGETYGSCLVSGEDDTIGNGF